MALEFLAGAVYKIVEQSWASAAEIVPILLAILAAYSSTKKEDFLEEFRRSIAEYSEEFVTIIVATGILRVILNIEATPLTGVYGQIVALFYFGYLFWKY